VKNLGVGKDESIMASSHLIGIEQLATSNLKIEH
jgi:hypothetical protein